MISCTKRFLFASAIVLFSLSTTQAQGRPNVKHVVHFADFSYDPVTTPDVRVGDTIEWVGDFTAHPLVNVSVPATATPIENSADVPKFDYVVKVTGQYRYECGIHGPSMHGDFAATTQGVSPMLAYATDVKITPSPASTSSTISFQLSQAGEVAIKLVDDRGAVLKEVTAKRYAQGSYSLNVDVSSLSNGAYFYQFRIDGNVSMKQFIVKR